MQRGVKRSYGAAICGGTADVGGSLDVNFLSYTPQMDDRWELLFADSISYHALDNIALALLPYGFQDDYALFIEDQGGRDVLVLYIPEPTNLVLFALGGMLLFRRRGAKDIPSSCC